MKKKQQQNRSPLLVRAVSFREMTVNDYFAIDHALSFETSLDGKWRYVVLMNETTQKIEIWKQPIPQSPSPAARRG